MDSSTTAHLSSSVSLVSVLKYQAENSTPLTQKADKVAVEAPLEIRVNGVILATLMRTPGSDTCLVRGFLITEGIIQNLDEIELIEFPQTHQCLVILQDSVEIDLANHQRYLPNYGSCGICSSTQGVASDIELTSIQSNSNSLTPAGLFKALQTLNSQQSAFRETGGIHAAVLFNSKGEVLQFNEDIGRHNAVDKVIGAYFATPTTSSFDEVFLLVSSRLSYEIVQKSLIVGIPLVAALSAPSSLAIELAKKHQQTIIGFLRPPHFNLYHQGKLKVEIQTS